VESFIASWVTRLSLLPGAVAVILKGSHARGDAGPHSDVDFDVLAYASREPEYPAWFVPYQDRIVHVSVAVVTASAWLASASSPERWALGFRAAETTSLRWAVSDGWRARLDRPFLPHPAGPPEVEDFVAELGKLANARIRGDDLGVRLAARAVAGYAPGLLRPLNPEVVVGSRDEAVRAALAFPVAPPRYRDDMLTALGFTTATADEVAAAAQRLVVDVIAMCATIPERYGNMADQLAAGTIADYVAQLARAASTPW
jgi:predicted nucleotidyltransferase